jgi:hypothetical protein
MGMLAMKRSGARSIAQDEPITWSKSREFHHRPIQP